MATKKDIPSVLDDWLQGIPRVACFREVLKIYAPTCYGDCEAAVDHLRDEISKVLGGSTTYNIVTGCWWDPDEAKMECEPGRVIEAAHNCQTKEELYKIAKAIVDYGIEADQKSISILNNKFFIGKRPHLEKHLEELKAEIGAKSLYAEKSIGRSVEVYTSEVLSPEVAQSAGLHRDPQVDYRYTTVCLGDLSSFRRDLQELLRKRTNVPLLIVDAYYNS